MLALTSCRVYYTPYTLGVLLLGIWIGHPSPSGFWVYARKVVFGIDTWGSEKPCQYEMGSVVMRRRCYITPQPGLAPQGCSLELGSVLQTVALLRDSTAARKIAITLDINTQCGICRVVSPPPQDVRGFCSLV